jgi:hypothetical protein
MAEGLVRAAGPRRFLLRHARTSANKPAGERQGQGILLPIPTAVKEARSMTAKNEQPQTTGGGGARDSGRPETDSGAGRTDVTGIVPDDVHVDPDITEGHPGYQESGDSEIIPPPGSTRQQPAGGS